MSMLVSRNRITYCMKAIAFVVLVGLVGVCACGITPGEAKKITITYAGWGSPAEIEAHKAEVAAFHKKYPDSGIEIELQFTPWSGYHEKLLVLAAGGMLPDLMIISGEYFRNLATQGMFLNLRPFFERDKLDYDNLPPGSPAFCTYKGELVAMPISGFNPGGPMLVYNRDILANAAIPDPKPEWTWDNLLEIARRTTRDTNGDGKPDTFGLNFAKTTWWAVWGPLLRSNGGTLYDEDYDECVINSDAGIKTFQFLADLDDRWHVHGGNFEKGTTAMIVSWGARKHMQERDFEVGVSVLPRGPHGYGIGPSLISEVPGLVHVCAVSKTTRNPEAVWKFLKFLVTEKEAFVARFYGFESLSWKPLMPVYKEVLSPKLLPEWEVALLNLKHMTPIPEAKIIEIVQKPLPTQGDVTNILNQYIGAFYKGEKPVREALDNVKQAIDNAIRKLRAKK